MIVAIEQGQRAEGDLPPAERPGKGMGETVGPLTGNELKELRRSLGINSQAELSALLHFMGGAPPAISTISRQERLPVASSTELVAFLRLLSTTCASHPGGPEASVPNFSDFLRYRFGDRLSEIDQHELETAKSNYRALIVETLQNGQRIRIDLLDGLDDRELILDIIRLAPGLAGQHLLRAGYGPEGSRQARERPTK